MARLELIQAKSAKVKSLTASTTAQTSNEEPTADEAETATEPDSKRRKLSEAP